jgi:hypothetical protein
MNGPVKISKLLGVILCCELLVSCAVGPKYHRPAVQAPTTFREIPPDPQQQAQVASYADLPWSTFSFHLSPDFVNYFSYPATNSLTYICW